MKIHLLVLVFVLIGFTSVSAGPKNVAVLAEVSVIHQSLFQNENASIRTNKLQGLLSKGGDSKEDNVILKKAMPYAKQLGSAKTGKDRLDAFAKLSDALSSIAQKEGGEVNAFYCPMVKKKWIAKGTNVQNPYDKSMKECGEKL